MKPVLVITALFYLFWHWFIPLSYKLQEVTSQESSHLPEIFTGGYQKRISPTYVFKILQLSANNFLVKTKGKTATLQETQQIADIVTLLRLLSADVLLRIPSLSKVEVLNFPLLHFPKWLCLVHGQLAMSLPCMKRQVICKCQCFCLFDIQQWSVLS